MKKKIYAAYHTHLQGTMTACDRACESSVRIKDRTSKDHGGANVAWGTGDTPIPAILQSMKTRGWKFPATVEVE